MTCGEALERLDDYVDGSLPEALLHEMELHLDQCAACRTEESHLRRLLREAAALPREMKPARDLWPTIAARIGEEQAGGAEASERTTRPWTRPAALAAAAAVLLAVATLMTQGGRRPTPSATEPAATAAQPAAGGETAHVQQAETEYLRATGQLMDALNTRRGSLSPETLRAVDENLRTIDEAVRQVRAALEKDPGNRQLTQMLASTHQKKLDLLLRLLRLSSKI
jgi:negative regulator of sigma E activity